MKKEHIARHNRRLAAGLQANAPRAGKSNTRAALIRERTSLFSISPSYGRVRHHKLCLSCLLDCLVLRMVDRSYAASIKRESGNEMQRSRESAVQRDVFERGDSEAVYTFESCPKLSRADEKVKTPEQIEREAKSKKLNFLKHQLIVMRRDHMDVSGVEQMIKELESE
jgi:hypothetical protein